MKFYFELTTRHPLQQNNIFIITTTSILTCEGCDILTYIRSVKCRSHIG